MVPTFYDLWKYVEIRNKELARDGDMWRQRTPERTYPENTRVLCCPSGSLGSRGYAAHHCNSVLFL